MARVAGRQFGHVSRRQLAELGVDDRAITRWVRAGYLHRVLPHVYGVGHTARTTESRMAAALLYASPGAALSHATAAWWLGLLDEPPRVIQVTTPRKCRSVPGVRVYDRRARSRLLHRGLTTTTVPQTLLDLAAAAPRRTLRKALANAEYRRMLDLREIEAVLGPGHPGAVRLRAAVRDHQPRLARTRSGLEDLLVEVCEQEDIPLPEINVMINGWEVDALWRQARLVVELDGYGNHHTPAQLRRDRRKEMAVRAMGLDLLRYSEEQLTRHRIDVAAELKRATSF